MFKFLSKAKTNQKKRTRIDKKRLGGPSDVKRVGMRRAADADSPLSASPNTSDSPIQRAGTSGSGKASKSEREKLIENALQVHRTQSKLLDDIDDGLKERVRALAMKKFMGEDEPNT